MSQHLTKLQNLILDELEHIKLAEEITSAGPLKEKHYLVETVEQYGLAAKKLGFKLGYDGLKGHWIHNGLSWEKLDPILLKSFLSEAGVVMGADFYDMKHYRYRNSLLKQFEAVSYRPKLKQLSKIQGGDWRIR